MRIHRRVGSVAAVLGLTFAGMAATAGTAHAASYNGACGSGYGVIDSRDVGLGTTFLTYNSSNGYNCVVTVSDVPGQSVYMQAALGKSSWPDQSWLRDSGYYKYYAGPLYLHAPGSCIDWGGGVNDNYLRMEYNDHCG